MAKSTGIVLTAGAVSLGSQWLNSGDINFRAGMAWLGVALVFDGIEKLSEVGAVGLATITFITVLSTPVKGKAPAEVLADLLENKTTIQKEA